MASRRKGSNSSRNSEATVQNGTRNGYGHSYLQRTTGPNGTTVNGPGPANQSQRELYDGSTNVYYGYGGPFRPDNDTDRSSEISVRSDDFLGNYKHQQWMDKITGDTFKRNYLDRISFRPTLAHDPTIPLQDAHDFWHDDNPNISNAHAQDPSSYKKEKNRNALKKVLIAILVLLFLGGISGVLAWYFTIKGDEDTSINYYVVTSEMALSNDYYPELSDSSSQEFKNLSTQFCDAITEALRKNSTEYGDRYKHCEVTAFKNGSIIVFYKLFYVYLQVQITKEKVQQDLNKSLTNVDPERAKLSDFVIIRASVKFTVEVQTFQTDPIVPSTQLITSTTELPTTEETTTSEAVTTTTAKSTEAMITTEVKTTGESTTTTTETTSTTTKEATSTMAVATTIMEATTTPPPPTTGTSEATSTTAGVATTTAESTTMTAPPPLTTTTAKVTTTAESTNLTTTPPLTTTTTTTPEATTTEAPSTTTLAETSSSEAILTTADATTTTAESTTLTTTPPLTTTTTTTTTETTTTEATSTTTMAATSTFEAISTPADATSTTAESTTLTTPPPLTTTTIEATSTKTTAEATITEATSTTTTLATTSTLEAISTKADATTTTTTTTTRESTTLTTTIPLTTTTSETTTTTESTTPLAATSTFEAISTPAGATSTTAESTTPPTTTPTTEAPSTLFTTERSTRLTSEASSKSSKASTTIGTSESSPKQTTVDTTESSTSTTMGLSILTTKGTTEMSTSLTTQSSTISTIGTTEVSGSTTMVTTTTSEQYTADVVVSPIIAIYGETTTTKTCVISPRGNWVHVTVTIENQGTPYAIRKYHSNKTFEEPASLERFNASISSTDTEIVVYLSLDLQAPTTDMCSWDGKYTFSCSITMNDTISTRVYNGGQVFITAPIYDVTIDSNVHYNEGDKMTFNCSSKGDPNHSMVYTELIKGSAVLQTIIGQNFSSGYNDTSDNNCLADFQWSGGSPNPLTTDQNDVIVRCTVKNTLLNESRTSEKRLNVSVVEYESSTMSTTMGTTESSTISTTMITTESSTTSTTMERTESSTTTTPVLKYSADVKVYPVIGIFGDTATTQVCAFTPHGDWLYATLTVENQNTQYVIGKFLSNRSLEEPDSLERFNISMSNKNMDIVVHLTLNLQTPTTDTCSMDGKYTFTCSITMNDTMQTRESNGSQIFMTAPMSEISIDSEVNYNEGEKMTFNCSMTGDPNYSTVYVDMIKNSQILYTIPGPVFGADYISNCSAVLNWSGGPPTPLTSQENDLIVRCVVKNNLLNETRNSEKKLNVSAADVAFKKYSYQALTSSRQEIECIARSPMSILLELIISKDDVQIATLNSSGIASSTDVRYSTNIQEYDGEVRLTLSILSVECQDQGRYNCKLITTNNATRVSPEMSFIVEGSKPTMTLHPDIHEPFAILGFNHVCSTEHIGEKSNANFLEIQISIPGSLSAFTYSKKIAEVEKMFDSTYNITYINITGTAAQFLLVSHTSSSSNLSCNIKETITFLLKLKMEFDNGTIKCVLKDEMEEFSAVESRITVIPGNFCDGYEHSAFRKHPNNDCNDYIDYEEIQGKMYAIGNQCPSGQCIQFATEYCVPCNSTFTCDELTTPGPTITTTTLPPGRRYVSCNDFAHFLGTTAVIRCIILDTFFTSLNITFLSEHSQNEEYVGEIFPDGQTQSIPQSPIILSTNFDLSPKILMFTFQQLKCSSKGRYRIIAGGTNSSVAASVETFELNVLGNLTGFQIHIEPEYPEGTLVDFNCTASLDESQANIKGYYKKETESGFFEIKGTTTVIERNMSHCFVKVLWKPSTPFAAYTSFNNADLMCELVDWPLVQPTKQIFVQNADVAFETYKLESSIGSQVSVKCLARNTNFIKSILIRKIENPFNTTVANVTFPNMTSHVDGTTVSYTNNSLKLTFSSIKCSDDGQYLCIVIKEDESQLESPAYLLVHLRNPPKHKAVTFTLHPDIKDDKYDTNNVHTCSGDVGYPSGLGYLSLKFTDPTTNASFTYDKLTVTEEMKTSLELPLKFKVSLASGLSIIIVNDDEPDSVNCTRTKEIKFLLQATRDWNKAKIRCRVISETNEVNFAFVEKEIYVIPDAVCDGSNGSDIYVPHEKIDECRTYIRCFNNKPTGRICGNALCFDHKKNYCNWCKDVACESEMGSTTERQITTTSSLPTVPEIQCPLLSCKPSSVFEMESGNIVCELNTSMKYDNITVMKNGQAIMTVYPNGTNYYFSDDFNKYYSTVGTSFTFKIKNVSCLDENEYTFTVEVSVKGSCYKTASLEMKAKPGTPTLVIDYTWTEGTNLGTHSCTGSIGNPPGTMTLEIRDGETGNFTSFSPSTKSLTTMKENCHYDATLTFSIDFNTENIQSHYIRCVANNQHTLLSSEFPFYSKEVFVNPLPANACFENGLHLYPGDCTRFLNCYNNITFAIQCPSGLCFENYHCGNSCTGCNT